MVGAATDQVAAKLVGDNLTTEFPPIRFRYLEFHRHLRYLASVVEAFPRGTFRFAGRPNPIPECYR